MASPAATEFLTKQITVEKEIVTFRWLSRALSIHVNVAKNELASFHASSQASNEPVYATFLLTGDVAPVKATGSYQDENEMHVDNIDAELVLTTKLVLVGEDELETAKTQFTRLSSVHIYSLSPSVIRDAALLAPTADRVRPGDVSKGKAFNQMVGIVVGSDVKVGRGIKVTAAKTAKANTTASSSKLRPPSADETKKIAEKPKSADKGKELEKAKPEDKKKKGTLDWSKAKTKAEKEEAAVVKKEKEAAAKKEKEVIKKESKTSLKKKAEDSKVNVKEGGGSKANVKKETKESKEPKVNSKKDAAPKRGTKRPSAVMSLSDSEDSDEDSNPAPKTKPRKSASPLPSKPASKTVKGVKIKKGVLISDEEDEEIHEVKPKVGRLKGKGRAVVSDDEEDAELSVRAMMDLDDSLVTRHNQVPVVSDQQSDNEDVEMLSDSEPIPVRPKQKRKPKKVIPLGTNGLPKKRVLKSRKSKNARGFMVTEDYSSYESISESEHVAEPSDNEKKSKKGKTKAKKEDNAASASASEKLEPSKARSKPRTSTKPAGDVEDSSAEQSTGTKSENKRPGSDPGGGGSKSAGETKGGKKNITSYFAKK